MQFGVGASRNNTISHRQDLVKNLDTLNTIISIKADDDVNTISDISSKVEIEYDTYRGAPFDVNAELMHDFGITPEEIEIRRYLGPNFRAAKFGNPSDTYLRDNGISTQLRENYDFQKQHVPKSSIDLTLFRHNYMGPGTDVVANVENSLKPTDYADKLSLKHDLRYALSNLQSERIEADYDFIGDINEYNKQSPIDRLEANIAAKALKIKADSGIDFFGQNLAQILPLNDTNYPRKKRKGAY